MQYDFEIITYTHTHIFLEFKFSTYPSEKRNSKEKGLGTKTVQCIAQSGSQHFHCSPTNKNI